jgi:SET domain-containing protein
MNCEERAPFHVRESAVHGRGVFANASIRSGQLIGRFEGVPAQEDGTYVLWIIDENEAEVGIDGRNALRFLNHAGQPNAEFEGQDLYALCDVQPGSEILIHYGAGWEENESCDAPGQGVIHDQE